MLGTGWFASAIDALLVTCMNWMQYVLLLTTTDNINLKYEATSDTLRSALAYSFPFFVYSDPGTLIASSASNFKVNYNMPFWYQDTCGILFYVHPDHLDYLNGSDTGFDMVATEHWSWLNMFRHWWNMLRGSWFNQLDLPALAPNLVHWSLSSISLPLVFMLTGIIAVHIVGIIIARGYWFVLKLYAQCCSWVSSQQLRTWLRFAITRTVNRLIAYARLFWVMAQWSHDQSISAVATLSTRTVEHLATYALFSRAKAQWSYNESTNALAMLPTLLRPIVDKISKVLAMVLKQSLLAASHGRIAGWNAAYTLAKVSWLLAKAVLQSAVGVLSDDVAEVDWVDAALVFEPKMPSNLWFEDAGVRAPTSKTTGILCEGAAPAPTLFGSSTPNTPGATVPPAPVHTTITPRPPYATHGPTGLASGQAARCQPPCGPPSFKSASLFRF